MHVKLALSSMKRLVDCKLTYFYQIPKGAFLDLDRLGDGLFGRCHAASPFLLEELADSVRVTDLKPVLFHTAQELRKVFVFEDEFQFPVQLRYNPPQAAGGECVREMSTPTGCAFRIRALRAVPPAARLPALRRERHIPGRGVLPAESREGGLTDCPGWSTAPLQLACECDPAARCDFFRVELGPDPGQLVQVPAGERSRLPLVGGATLTAVGLALARLLRKGADK